MRRLSGEPRRGGNHTNEGIGDKPQLPRLAPSATLERQKGLELSEKGTMKQISHSQKTT